MLCPICIDDDHAEDTPRAILHVTASRGQASVYEIPRRFPFVHTIHVRVLSGFNVGASPLIRRYRRYEHASRPPVRSHDEV